MEHTKEVPGAFDAFETAKPGEPIFTLQGGDPLAAPLVLQWAKAARLKGLELRESTNPVEQDKGEVLLLKATEAEQISWDMDRYRKGEAKVAQRSRTETESYSGHKASEEMVAQMDEHRSRLAAAQTLSYLSTAAFDAVKIARKYGLDEVADEVEGMVPRLKEASSAVQGRFRG